MFTNKMYDRLSEWMGNVSILFLGSVALPTLLGNSIVNGDIIKGGILIVASLWLSLRLSRMSERGRV